jgi:signal transduction histidine kinase
MKRVPGSAYQWTYTLTVCLLLLATVLRTLIVYRDLPAVLTRDLALLAAWLFAVAAEPAVTRRWPNAFLLCLAAEAGLLAGMLLSPQSPDYFAILFGVLSMRLVQQASLRVTVLGLVAFAALIWVTLAPTTGLLLAAAFGLTYSTANAFFAYFSLEVRRLIQARSQNETMQRELQDSNRRLQAYSDRLKQLAAERERHRIARDLHDSVTQTVFSMALTVQAATLLLERDPARVKPQLDHLSDLATSALTEMQTLVTELRPTNALRAGLADALRGHIAGRTFPERLSVSLEVEGDAALSPAEEQGLFRIAQEALNNIAKHAQATRACLTLHLAEPVWVEIADDGRGFVWASAGQGAGMGLSSMRERAAEIGWELEVVSRPGGGTRIRAQKGSGDGSRRKD